MKFKSVAVVLSLFFLLPALPASAGEVLASSGSIQAGLNLKWLYGYSERDSETLHPGREQFSTKLVDLTLDGHLGDKLAYRIELAGSWDQDTGTGGVGMISGPNSTGTFGVRQAYFVFADIIPWTLVTMGTFIPEINNYSHREPENLDMIQYPLMYDAVNMDTGMFGNRPAARDLSVWQQAGVNFNINMPYMVEADLGFYNGIMPTRFGNQDANVAKAASFDLTFRPIPTLAISMAYWGEEFQKDFPPPLALTAKRQLAMWTVYASYLTDLLEVTADYSRASVPDGQLEQTGDYAELGWEGYQITAGYWLTPRFQMLGRYERFDPNVQDSVKIPDSRYDSSSWFTLGANYRLTDNTEVSANYVWKWEEAHSISHDVAGQDPNLPGYGPKYSAQENDLLLIQVQSWM